MTRPTLVLPCMLLPCVLLFAAMAQPGHADPCVDCHSKETPGSVKQWRQSAHADQVACADCHGDDHDATQAGKAMVTAAKCGRCHEDAYAQHSQSKHGLGLHSGWGCTRAMDDRDPRECGFCHEKQSTIPVSTVQCARFLTQTSEMGEAGCNRCHQIELSCGSCHTNHITDLAVVRNPNVCAKCHMGPDHPQWEMWQTSQHGTLYESVGAELAPTCQTCHMASGTHDVSRGITVAPSGKQHAPEKVTEQRAAMLQICSECHASGFSERDLTRADAILAQSAELVGEAEAIVWDMHDRGLLQPMPGARPDHPIRGAQLVTDGQMLYEDISHLERLFFKMKKYDFAKTWKGAYHQNPAYTHWYGNAELKMSLVDIRSEALQLESAGPLVPLNAPRTDTLEDTLDLLKKKHARGAIDAETYERERERLLRDAFGHGEDTPE